MYFDTFHSDNLIKATYNNIPYTSFFENKLIIDDRPM